MRSQQPVRSRIQRFGSARAFALWLRAHVRLALLLLLVASGLLGPLAQNAGTLFPTVAAHGLTTQSTQATKPGPLDPHAGTTSVNHQPPGATLHVNRATDTPAPMSRPSGITMPQGLLPLQANAAATFRGQDGRFEIDAPAGAITAADQAAAGGGLQLAIRQVAPASGSSAGGSGLVSFGQYLVQVVDGSGVLVNQGLRKPITIKMHLPQAASAVDLGHAFVVFNSSPPVGVSSAPTSASAPDVRSGASANDTIPGLGALSSQPTSYDSTQQTLSTTYTLSGPSALMSWDTNSSVATFGHPDPFTTDLSGGGLTTSIPLDVPSGPGGLTPPVALTYSSAAVSEQHNIQAAAGWVGEGWNLSFGSITWSEHNSNATCTSGCGNGWEDTWQLSDPFGTAVELIPPSIQTKTYFDDTDNSISGSPIRWHAAPENHAKIYSYVTELTLPDGKGVHPPCFRVWLTNGIMEEFGCTADALEYYTSTVAGVVYDFLYAWNLDLITDPQGNQIHVTYQQDIAGSVNHYIRDAEPATVEWDSPNCHDAQQMCTGANWAPLMRVQFAASYAMASGRLLDTPLNCNTAWHLRCDDAIDLRPSGGEGPPGVVNTLALQDALVQVRTSASGSWNTLKDYQFFYNQNGPRTTTDAATGQAISAAGYLLLGRLNVVGMNGVSLPTSNFSYITQPQFYEDSNYHPTPATNCGPSWNTGTGSGCFLWSQNQPGNSYFLSTYENGMGLHESFTWRLARNNTHGVSSGGDPTNPFWCDDHQTSSPCQEVDDQNWSRVVLTETDSSVKRATSGGDPTVDSSTVMSYKLTYPLVAQECGDCKQGMYWGNQNDGDYMDYYNAVFMGFAQANVSNPDGSVVEHHYYSTEGYGLYDGSVPCLAFIKPCRVAPWWDLTNAAHGREIETDYYDTNGTTLLRQDKASYAVTCPPSGVAGSPSWSTTLNGSPYTYTWDGKLVAALDHGDPVAACAVQLTQTDNYTFDGSASTISKTTTYTYDSYGRVTQESAHSSDGGSTGNPTTIITKTEYVWNDAVTAAYHYATGTYLIDVTADTVIEDANNTTHYRCSFTSYDGHGFLTGQQSGLIVGEATTNDQYTSCGTSANGFATSGLIRTTHTYDTYGNQVSADDPDASAGDTAHEGCTVGSAQYSTCTTYDTIYQALTTGTTNALNQSELTGYGTPSASDGFGLWSVSTTDKNGQTTTYGYDGLGRMTSRTLPGETNAPTTSWTYTDWCGGAGSGPQTPCVEVDETQRLDSSNTITSRAFYDGYGNLVETRDAGPNGQDVVRYRFYDSSERDLEDSISYFVPAYTGSPGAAAFSAPDVNQPYTQTSYDGLGRVTSVKDPLGQATTTTYALECGEASDPDCYEKTTVIDANQHEHATLTSAFGDTLYDERYTGISAATYAVYAITRYVYDSNDNLNKIMQPNGSATTFAYDAAGRKTGMSDPDRGTEAYTYDADGNRIESVDARGGAGTVYAGYDAIDRQLWRNTTNSPTNAYVTYTYDSTSGGNAGIGHLTAETFTGGPNNTLSGSYSYVYDMRGQQISNTDTVGGTSYTIGTTYDDSGSTLTQTYPDGETVTNGYTAQGWLGQISTSQGNTTLLSAVTYSGIGGAGHLMTGAQLGNSVYRYSATYDALLRLTNVQLTRQSDSANLLEESRTFDPAGNLTALATTLSQGTDQQAFCYDDFNRLVWAGTTADNPCGNPATVGSFGGAGYTQSFGYDTLNRLTSGPLGSYTYGDSAHLHAATSVSSGYTAAYDASGDMTCRAPSSSTTCSGTQTGAQLDYNNEGQLTTWQDAPSSPRSTDAYLYDGEGNRVEQQVTTGLPGSPSTTTTVYVGNVEEVATTGSATTTTTYYYAGEMRIALAVNGVFSYLATDALGSTTIAFNATGLPIATTLYAPYGAARYSSGTMPTDYGFTGQHSDSATGLDYYGARYYDPLAGQFTSADTTLPGDGMDPWGLSRYAYVEGNPLIRVDPTGHDGGWLGGLVSAVTSTVSTVVSTVAPVVQAAAPAAVAVLDATTGIPSMINDVQTIFSGNASTLDKIMAGADILVNVAMDVSMVVGVGEGLRVAYVGAKVAEHVAVGVGEHALEHAGEDAVAHVAEHEVGDVGEHALEGGGCGMMSFAASTLVLTPTGERAIALLKTGDTVTAYDPQTGKASAQTVEATSIHHDDNLVDVTLQVTGATTPAASATTPATPAGSKGGVPASAATTAANATTRTPQTPQTPQTTPTHPEVVHTTANHPWLSADHGWLIASFLHVGEPVRRVDGSVATVVSVRSVPGAAAMWDLTVANEHTFAVGSGAFVVHNANCTGENDTFIGKRMERHVDDELLDPPAKRGNAPIERDTGKPIEIHHMGQDPDGPFVEMTVDEHRGPENNLTNHPIRNGSPVDHGSAWRREVRRYWTKEWDLGRWEQ